MDYTNKRKKILIAALIIIGIVLVIFGNNNFSKLSIQTNSLSSELDDATKKDIYNVLWQKDISNWPKELPSELTEEKLAKISPKTFSEEVFTMLQDVKTKTIPLVQRYPKRYDLSSISSKKGLNTRDVYALTETMGPDYFSGYAGMKSIKELEFPRDNGMHTDFQFGWNFFASNLKDENGNDIDLLVIYFRRAIYPPDVAKKMGLSEMDNQTIEQIIGLGYSDKDIHIQGADPAISGKTGLIELNNDPFLIKFGKNETKSINNDSMFPLSMKIMDPEKDITIDLTYEETKPLFLEGDNGKVPSIYNLGTWYYSIPNIKVSGIVNHAGDIRKVTGKSWFDNQWTAGVMPTGYPDNYYIRGLSNIINTIENKPTAGWGWDWMDVQFDNNTEITLANMHSTSTEELKNKGENPPEDSKNTATGKFINIDGNAENITNATITIHKWIKSENSGAWYPNGWLVEIPEKNMTFTMSPTSPDQLFTTAGGSEVREGGVKATGKMGDDDINGYGFGEGTAYAGEDYYFKQKFNALGIEDTEENRKLFTQQVPGIWLFIQSVILYLISIIIVISIIKHLYRIIFKPKTK